MSSLGKSFGLASSFKEEVMVIKKQGIVSILASDCERTKSASLRRTLSADMSSQKWQAQHGFYPLKKIASSEGFPVSIADSSSSSEGEEEYDQEKPKETIEPARGQFDVWSSIQEEKKKKEVEKAAQFDIWSSIISQKTKEESKNLPPAYVHPLVKRSASRLNGKSLEICTESLGSETGSDGFSSCPPSEAGDAEDDKEGKQHEPVTQKYFMERLQVVKYNNLAAAAGKKSPPRSFPPPIPSLSSRDGASLHMRSLRDNGRLVLEAVSVPSQNNFRAQRQDGRLVLTFINTPNEEEGEAKKEEEADVEQFDVEFENSEDEQEHEEDEEDVEVEVSEIEKGRGEEVKFVMEEAPKGSSWLVSVHRVPTMMNKSMVLVNRNPTWPNKFNEIIKFEEEGEEGEEEEEEEEEGLVEPSTLLTQSLPTQHPVARMIPSPLAAAAVATAKAPASLNAYEYFWRAKPMAAAVLNPVTQKPASINNNKLILSKNLMPNEQPELVVLRGNQGCKEPRRLLFWEAHCIATS